MQDYFGVFNWLSAHIHVPAWIIIVGLAWKASARWKSFTDKLEDDSNTINLVATNHLPHLQDSIKELDKNVCEGNTAIISELKTIGNNLFQVALKKD